MRYCKYPKCWHSERGKTNCKMHKFPISRDKCLRWLDACRLRTTPRKIPHKYFLCSCHFFERNGPTKDHPYPKPVEQGTPEDEDDEQAVDDVQEVSLININGGGVVNFQYVTEGFSDLAVPLPPESPLSESCALAPHASSAGSPQNSASSRREYESSPFCIRQPGTRGNEQDISGMGGKTFRDIGIQCFRPPFSYDVCRIHMDDEEFRFYTGLTKDSFHVVYEFLGGDEVCKRLKYRFAANTPKKELDSEHTPKDKLFITLVRLRRGVPLKDLSPCFHLSEATLSTIFYTWIRHMSLEFKTLEKDVFVSVAKQAKNPPACYKPFPNLRCIVDCTEIKIESPFNFQHQSNTHSAYKGTNTVKVLIATSVFGGLSFISEAAEGNISDIKLFLKCGIIDHLKPGEAVMCDKGFDIEPELNAIGVDLLIPPFLGQDRTGFTPRELLLNKAIATSRIHVERFIKMMKDYRLIRFRVPLKLLDILTDITRVCANLVNFEDPFLRWEAEDDTTK